MPPQPATHGPPAQNAAPTPPPVPAPGLRLRLQATLLAGWLMASAATKKLTPLNSRVRHDSSTLHLQKEGREVRRALVMTTGYPNPGYVFGWPIWL